VPADVGQQFDVRSVVHQHAATVEQFECVVVARFGCHQSMADITMALLEEMFQFQRVNCRIEVPGNGKLRRS